MAAENRSFVVYNHLGKFLANRELTSDDTFDLSRAEFISRLDQIGYYRVHAESPSGRVTVLILLALRGKFTEHGPHLRTLLSGVGTDASAKEGRLEEVIVIAPEDVMSKKNMTDVVRDFNRKNDRFYNIYAYHVFSIDVPNAETVPHHEIVPEDEAVRILERDNLTLNDLKMINTWDPPVVWIGGRPGQIIRTVSPMDTIGEVCDYWVVV